MPINNPLKHWSVNTAIATGVFAGLAVLLLLAFSAAAYETGRVMLIVALGVAFIAGVSILWINLLDMLRHRQRGSRIRAIRIFDFAVAALLLIPSGYLLSNLL